MAAAAAMAAKVVDGDGDESSDDEPQAEGTVRQRQAASEATHADEHMGLVEEANEQVAFSKLLVQKQNALKKSAKDVKRFTAQASGQAASSAIGNSSSLAALADLRAWEMVGSYQQHNSAVAHACSPPPAQRRMPLSVPPQHRCSLPAR